MTTVVKKALSSILDQVGERRSVDAKALLAQVDTILDMMEPEITRVVVALPDGYAKINPLPLRNAPCRVLNEYDKTIAPILKTLANAIEQGRYDDLTYQIDVATDLYLEYANVCTLHHKLKHLKEVQEKRPEVERAFKLFESLGVGVQVMTMDDLRDILRKRDQ